MKKADPDTVYQVYLKIRPIVMSKIKSKCYPV